MFQIEGSINLKEEGWIEFSREEIEIGTTGKIYGWHTHLLNSRIQNAVISIDVNIVAPETCEVDLEYKYMHPKSLMCGMLEGTNTEFVEVISLYNISIQ